MNSKQSSILSQVAVVTKLSSPIPLADGQNMQAVAVTEPIQLLPITEVVPQGGVEILIGLKAEQTNFVPFHVTPKGDCAVKGADKALDAHDLKWYRTRVHFSLSENNTTRCSKYPDNFVCLAVYRDGKVERWCIAVVSQNGQFYVTTQKLDEWDMVWSPAMGIDILNCDWPSFKTVVVTKLIEEHIVASEAVINGIESVTEYEARRANEVVEPPAELFKGVARVIKGNMAAQLYTAELSDDSNARVHWSQIAPRADGFRGLAIGDVVRYGAIVKAKQTMARTTNFKWELREVWSANLPKPAVIAVDYQGKAPESSGAGEVVASYDPDAEVVATQAEATEPAAMNFGKLGDVAGEMLKAAAATATATVA